MKTKYVYLGRFAPFHNGHNLLLSEMVNRYGPDKILVLIGSTNTINWRTPYTYEDRKQIIRISFPTVEILPLPDGKPNLEYFDGTTNEAWLDSIEAIAKARKERYVFCGGDKADLEVLAQRFETKVEISREVLVVSATQIRELLVKKDYERLSKFVDPKATEIIIKKFKSFI